MGLNLGAMAGGVAKGWSQGIEDKAKIDDAEWKKKERDRQEKDWAEKDQFKKEAAGISAQSEVDARNARAAEANAKMDADASAARISQEQFKNPASQGIMPTPNAEQPARTFSADMGQRQASNPIQGSGITVAPKPASVVQLESPEASRAAIIANGINPKQPEAQRVPLETTPLLADHISAAHKILALKQKYGQDTSMDQVNLKVMADKLKKEGVDQALPLLHKKDAKGTLDAINSNGDHVGWEQVGDLRTENVVIAEGMPPIETTIMTIRNKDGVVRTLDSVRDGYAAGGLFKQVEIGQKASEIAQTKKHQDAALKNQAAELGIKQSEHKDKRADIEKQKADAIEKANAAVAIYKERNPNTTPAQIEAVRRGVMEAIPKEAKNEYSSIVDQFGNTVTRTNKDTGAVDIIDVKKGAVKLSMPAPGARPGGAPAQPAGLVVGATTKQPDGVYSAAGKKVTISGGKIARIE